MKTLQQPNRQITTRRVVLANPRQSEANRARVQHALGRPLQAKLILGSPVDACEREAEAIADRVVASNAASLAPGEALQRKCRACDEDEALRRTAIDETAAPPIASEVLRKAGRPLSSAEKQFMEPVFARDFDRVRVHQGVDAAQAARAVNARAYTVGRDIVLGAGEGDFASLSGRHLLAHELAHVVQQGGACADGVPDESVIDEAAPAIAVDGDRRVAVLGTSGPQLQRENVSRPPTIRVVANHQYPLTAANVAAGLRSGNGGVSEMEVSNGTDNFDGQHVSEVFVGGGGDNPTVGGCNNAGGQGGQGGSTFTIGEAVSFSRFGININLPARANVFYDMHIKAFGTNVLPVGVNRNYSSCLQQYTMGGTTLNGGQVFNRVHNITRTNVGGQDCANIDLVKS